ncbi:hypothetical protein ONA70_26100, partial [Micromonospora yasonensis]|uniref:hypothetical protein n=1 Tax=Micromonospora yasonensis TaxID=1128667 RepID=UPI00222E53FC
MLSWTRIRIRLAGASAAAVLAGGLVAIPAPAAPPTPGAWRSPTQAQRSVPGRDFVGRPKPADPGAVAV